MHRRSLFLAAFLILLLGFGTVCFAMPPLDPARFPAAPDYSQASGWLAKPHAPSAPVDVFWVYPTVLFNDTDWALDPANPDMRAAAQSTIDTQAVVFAGQANIYAPMYRQMNLAGLGVSGKEADALAKMGFDDVVRAFSYYLKHENNGRPFFLAGHSQGSMILTNMMLQNWGRTGAEDRLIAALLIGWSLTPKNLEANPAVAMCENAKQTGCVISYNTMAAGRQSAAPTLIPGAYAVNPLTWTTDGNFAPRSRNLGAVFFDEHGESRTYPHFTSAQIVDSGLVVQPNDVELVTVKGGHFPAGVYHAFDYSLFFENLKANIRQRIEAFGN